MAAPRSRILLCNCNRTMQVDAKAVASGLGVDAAPAVASELCRRHVSAFEAAVKAGDDVLVACTQEAPLFGALHTELKGSGEARFVNIRETAGWSEEGAQAAPKMAALLALADVPAPEPVPVVSYASGGELLIVGPTAPALDWAQRLSRQLGVTVLVTGTSPAAELPLDRAYPVYSGGNVRIKGYLGAFEVSWEQVNPIDLEVCTRCGACARVCPEHAIDQTFQIDLDACRAHRQCVVACGSIRAIDFERAAKAREDRFDLVLDLSERPLFAMSQPPQGYLAPGPDAVAQAAAVAELVQLTGEFEKPRFFGYNERICAHARNEIVGCTNCLDVCSTRAIRSESEASRVAVDPHLCMGCGGCATVCPSGAMSYAYPRVADIGARLRAALGAYRKAGGASPCLLFHNTTDGREAVARLGRRGRGLPSHVIPLEVLHVASLGPDVWLGALALGAAQVAVLSAGSEAPEYPAALETQIGYANAILGGLGYGFARITLICAGDPAALETAVWQLERCEAPVAATFNLSNEKRRTLDYAIDHLARHAPQPPEVVALPQGAPFGRIEVDRAACTMCMACVGVCPSNALLDSKEAPQLKFIERNCIQCGLCAKTCPEDAISLTPRLALTAEAKTTVVLNETEPFNCVRCGRPFGTRQMIDNMLGRLSSHAMFAGPDALQRLKMCADCRVLDMMEKGGSATISDFPDRGGTA